MPEVTPPYMSPRLNRHFDWLAPLSTYRPLILMAVDLLGTLLTFFAALTLNIISNADFSTGPIANKYQLALAITLILQPFVFDTFGLYRPWRGDSPLREIVRALSAWLALLAAMILLAGMTKTTAFYSRTWFGLWCIAGMVWIVIVHGTVWLLVGVVRRRVDRERILLVGDVVSASRVVHALSEHPDAGFEPAGYCAAQPSSDATLRLLPYAGPVHELNTDILKGVDQIWLVFSSAEHENLRASLWHLQHLTIPVRLVPNLLSVRLLSAPVSYAAGMTLFDLNVAPIYGLARFVKGAIDEILAVAVLMVLMPLFIVIALGIKLSSAGPIFFRQDREGYNGKTFRIYKFRTMHLHQFLAKDVQQATRDDPRIFPLGRFLRRSSFDELPQLVNVIKGDMSLVGPRPHAVEHSETYRPLVEFYGWRHMVKPGITGWAQIHGYRGETETPEKMRLRIEHDLYYVRNWSLWFDIEILLLTIFKGAFFRNAY